MQIKTTLEKVNEALSKIQDNGGKVTVQGSAGAFSIQGVIGRFFYQEHAEMLTVTIDEKPWLVRIERVEDEIKIFFK